MKNTKVKLLDGKEYPMAFTLAARIAMRKEIGKNPEEIVTEIGDNEEIMFKIIFIMLTSQIEPFPYDYQQFLLLADIGLLSDYAKIMQGDSNEGNP